MDLSCGHILHFTQEVQGVIYSNQVHCHWYYNPQQNLGTITMIFNTYPFNL